MISNDYTLDERVLDMFGVLRDKETRYGIAYRYVERCVESKFLPGVGHLIMRYHGGRNTSRRDRSSLFGMIEQSEQDAEEKRREKELIAKMKGLNVHAKPFVPESIRKNSKIPLYKLMHDPMKPRKFFRARRKKMNGVKMRTLFEKLCPTVTEGTIDCNLPFEELCGRYLPVARSYKPTSDAQEE